MLFQCQAACRLAIIDKLEEVEKRLAERSMLVVRLPSWTWLRFEFMNGLSGMSAEGLSSAIAQELPIGKQPT
jgi:hypothetical protein